MIILSCFRSTSFAISLKVSSGERKRIVMLMASVQVSPCDFVGERDES